MKYSFYAVFFLLLVPSVGATQQQKQPPFNPPAYGPPPIAPDRAPESLPPDMVAPPPVAKSNLAVQMALQESILRHPSLAASSLKASVSDDTIVLTGTVADENQHQAALQLVQSQAGNRKIEDRIIVKP
jgi:hypothetical protein